MDDHDVRPAANNPARRRRAARHAESRVTRLVEPTPLTADALAPPALPHELEPLAQVIVDAPAAYLAHLLAASEGHVEFAIAMHFDGGGTVPPEWRTPPALPSTNSTVEAIRPPPLEKPTTAEDASWHLEPLPPAPVWAPNDVRAGPPALVWVRAGDMRLADNAALHAAVASGRPIVPVYIEPSAQEQRHWPVQGAAAYWLHHSLNQLQHGYRSLGSALVLRAAVDTGGDSASALLALVYETGAAVVYFNAAYEPWRVASDERAMCMLREEACVCVERCAGNVLFEPWDARPDEQSQSAGFGSVGFFLSAVAHLPPPPPPLPKPSRLRAPSHWPTSLPLRALCLARLPVRRDGTRIDWAAGLRTSWAVGEEGGRAALRRFLANGIRNFESRERFRCDELRTAAISPHVRFGELSARTVRQAVRDTLGAKRTPTFDRRLAWRDLAYWSLWRFPDLADEPFRKHYGAQEWTSDPARLASWQRAGTGFPLVDAALTQLWHIGWMPNYLRHVVAGFLVEFLNVDWRHGERWFHDTLVDADVAINAFMWQNGGHSGFDQWNFVMHPVYAAKACDPEGDYVRRWLPQLAKLPVEYIHCPWEAPFGLRTSARVLFGGERGYPHRVIEDLEAARRLSHDAVMRVRRSEVGKRFVLPSGHEWYELDTGKRVILITRQDYREGSVTREGVEVSGNEIITRQTAEPKWDLRRRERTDMLSRALQDSV
eukprot:CAMPEP_0119359834 /NCGR_PEP_ID=MMETSP1334-20130426/7618_1 /TAXON_ID=127549 /ORGANISM="Calcidiscus leptoporus, Strain RCC1130" /LENGTH=715 /DNA_ID=CAMNT_0007374575 /DNA_START=14 /DNA_END=2158 /DNA_ORIENTATION=+